MQASYLLSPTLVEHVHQALDITTAGQDPCTCMRLHILAYTCTSVLRSIKYFDNFPVKSTFSIMHFIFEVYRTLGICSILPARLYRDSI
jgi:hypothetical protein